MRRATPITIGWSACPIRRAMRGYGGATGFTTSWRCSAIMTSPRSQGRGSAIFLHLAHSDYRPTEGCVAIAREHMLVLLSRLGPGDELLIE